MRFCVLGISLLLASTPVLCAQTAAERREVLAQIRERMADPDPLMRIAYLEELAESKDQTGTMVALRYAMSSDDRDLKALATRLYMANAKTLDLKIRPSDELMKQAKDPKGTLERPLLALLGAGYLRMRVTDFEFQSSSFTVHSMTGLNTPDDRFSGPGQVRGMTVTFSVPVYSVARCTFMLQPDANLDLVGEASCGTGLQYPTVPVSMPMF